MARILLVDDDVDFLQALQDELDNLGHEVTAVDSGTQGLQKFNEAIFDVVITDIVMHDGNGINLIKSVRRANSKARIIVISAHSLHVNDAVEELGADKALWKPFRIRQLQTLLDELAA